MPKFTVQCVETHTYEVTVEADDEMDAIDIVRDYDTDQLEEFEVDARWDYEVIEEIV